MPNQLNNQSFSSQILYPKPFSDQMIEALLSEGELPWFEISNLLDQLISNLVQFGYQKIPGVRIRMEEDGITPNHITGLESYESLFPLASITQIENIGLEKFQLQDKERSLRAHQIDFEVIAKHILIEGEKKDRSVLIADVTVADARAASLSIAGKILKEGAKTNRVLVNQKAGDYLGHDLLKQIVIPAFDLVGLPSYRVMDTAIQTDKKSGLLLPPDKSRVVESLNPDDFDLIIATDGRYYPKEMIYLGDYSYGLFPNMGYSMPFPFFIRSVDSNGRVRLDQSGEPDTNLRGRIVIDRLFSAYEIPNLWTLLLDGLGHLLDYIGITGQDSIRFNDIERFWDADKDYEFTEEFRSVSNGAGFEEDFDGECSIEDVHKMYSLAFKNYYRKSIRIGVPSSTWLMRVGLPIAAQIESNGLITAPIELSLGSLGAYVPGKNLHIKYSQEETPYISHNIIGITRGKNIAFPEFCSSALSKRVQDVLEGRNMFSPGEEGYLYTVPITSPGEFTSMLNAANVYKNTVVSDCIHPFGFKDILEILSKLYRQVEIEIDKTLSGERSMISLFAEKIKLPISEIMDMLRRAKVDFIDNDGLGIKKIAYAAFIDAYGDINALPEKELAEGLKILRRKKPRSPVFMVTPGNITLYDSFCLFVHILMANLTNQSSKRFTMYIRPSESDITFNFLIYSFHKIAREMDPDNNKGLRTLIQRAYWDPRYDSDFLQRAMGNAESGIYYGTAKTYMQARFNAALDVAEAKGYDQFVIEILRQIGSSKKNQFQTRSLDAALSQGIQKELVEIVREFISLHMIYPETLNGIVILPDSDKDDLEVYAQSVLSQVISTRGADCTNANKLWIHRGTSTLFIKYFEHLAGKLTCGDVFNKDTKMAQYNTNYLKGTLGIISGREDTRIISPTLVESSETAPQAISPDDNYTGVLLTEIDICSLITGDPIDQDTYISHLSKEIPLPWLTIVIYDDIYQVLTTMEAVLQKYSRRSGYPKYLYISILGGNMVDEFEAIVKERGLTDLVKKGDEANKQFIPYRPHQGGFFVNELVV